MAAPPKPWERTGVNHQNFQGSFSNAISSMPQMSEFTENRGTPIAASNAPPLPPRPATNSSSLTSGYGGYGSGANSGYGGMYGSGMYGSSMYGSGYGGGYGGYGGYGGMYGGGGLYGGYGGMNRFGTDPAAGNIAGHSFARFAEENSRQAFQSVETVVQAFGSVAMMLESTFYAVYNSFRAVIGVADQMSRVKAHFAQIFSALAVIKTLRWLYRKLLVFFGLRTAGFPEDAWSQATTEGLKSMLAEQEIKGGKKSSWPILIFFAIVMGGPWLIWRLLSSMYSNAHVNEWMDGTDDHFIAVGEHNFTAQRDEELSFRRGQKIIIAPKEIQPQLRGWLLACLDGTKQGLVPANYLKVLGKRRGTRHSKQEPQTRQSLGFVSEPTSTNPGSSTVNLDAEFESLNTKKPFASSPDFSKAFSNSENLPNVQSQPNINHQTPEEVLDEVVASSDESK